MFSKFRFVIHENETEKSQQADKKQENGDRKRFSVNEGEN
jgi:hypothetical protein